MKPEELRIGNLVYESYGGMYEVQIIDSVNEWVGSVKPGCNIVGRFNMDQIKPIPLTEEWLLKYGAKLKEETSYPCSKYYKLKGVMISIDLARFWIPKTKIYGEYAILTCPKYVHKFQNLVYELTGEELTI